MNIHQNIPNVVGHLIRAARKANGFTQTDLAKALGFAQKQISSWEAGTALPTSVELIKLSGVMGINFPSIEGPTLSTLDCRAAEVLEYIEEISDLLHAIDKIGDGIGGADGFAVSAVALNAKSLAENALGIIRKVS